MTTLPISHSFQTLFLAGIDVLMEITVVFLLAGAMTWVLRSSSAAVRAAVWTGAFAAVVLVVLATPILPTWSFPSLTTNAGLNWPSAAGGEVPGSVAAPIVVLHALPKAATRWSVGSTVVMTMVLIYLVGVFGLALRLVVHAVGVRRILCRSPSAGPRIRKFVVQLCDELGVRPACQVFVSDELAVPASTGVWWPAIILPTAAEGWSRWRLRAAVGHELAHVVRRDHVALLLSEGVRAVMWIHPLVWWAAHRLHVERERACDDLALESGLTVAQYAAELVALARQQWGYAPAPVMTMASRSGLAERVKRLLDPSVHRHRLGRPGVAVIAVLALAVALPMAAMEIFGQSARSVSDLIEQLHGTDAAASRHAAWALGEREDPEAVPALIASLRDGVPDVRLVAAWALGEIKDARAIPALAARIGDDDAFVREMATLALGEIEHPAAVPELINAAAVDESLRPAVRWALAEIPGEEAHVASERFAMGDVRQGHEPVWSGSLGGMDEGERNLDVLVSTLTAADPDIRRLAAMRLGRLGDVRAVSPLLDTLRDPEPTVRAMAVWALDEINPSRNSLR